MVGEALVGDGEQHRATVRVGDMGIDRDLVARDGQRPAPCRAGQGGAIDEKAAVVALHPTTDGERETEPVDAL
jgi:hypothetical protein